MMKPRTLGLSLCILSLMAVPSSFAGSQQQPDLKDAENDIQYSPMYASQDEHEYLDFRSAWVDYDPKRDELEIGFSAVDWSSMESPPRDWAIVCYVRLQTVLGDGEDGRLTARWQTYGHTEEGRISVNWSGSDGSRTRPVQHGGNVSYGAPGIVITSIERQALMNYMDRLDSIEGSCAEIFVPGGVVYPTPLAPSASIVNYDYAPRVNFTLDLYGLLPEERESADPEFRAANPEREESTPVEESPLMSSAALFAMLLASWVRRRTMR